jgi:acyl-homoserine-lactone acylase
MKTILKNTVVRFCLTASCVALSALIGACAITPTAGSRTVTVQRTTFGIAHVTAPDWEGIAYGTAYAHAQDNVCQTAEHLLTLRGERSQFLGAQALGDLGRMVPNAQIDLFIRFHMDDEALARAAATNGQEVQSTLRGYVAGYNRYLTDVGSNGLPEACRGKPWVRPMTMADLSRATEGAMIQGGVGVLAVAVLAAAPPAAKVSQAPVDLSDSRRIDHLQRQPEGGELSSTAGPSAAATPDGAASSRQPALP